MIAVSTTAHRDWCWLMCVFLVVTIWLSSIFIYTSKIRNQFFFKAFIESTRSTIKKNDSHLKKFFTWSDITYLEENIRHKMICTKITEYLQSSVQPHWLLYVLVLNWFNWHPVAVRLPAFIAVGPGSDFSTGHRHGWFGHAILQLKTTRVRLDRNNNNLRAWWWEMTS